MLRSRPITVMLGAVPVAVACGSGGTSELHSFGNGGPAHTAESWDAGSSSSSSGGSHATGDSGGVTSPMGPTDGSVADAMGRAAVAFVLIEAPTGTPVVDYNPIASGATIDLSHVGRAVNIRANPPAFGVIGSVAFALDATYTYTTNQGPYTLCGDDSEAGLSEFAPCILSDGKHTLTLTMYPQPDLGGTPYPPAMLDFSIVDGSADAGDDAE